METNPDDIEQFCALLEPAGVAEQEGGGEAGQQDDWLNSIPAAEGGEAWPSDIEIAEGGEVWASGDENTAVGGEAEASADENTAVGGEAGPSGERYGEATRSAILMIDDEPDDEPDNVASWCDTRAWPRVFVCM
jgi:hypothetical protein